MKLNNIGHGKITKFKIHYGKEKVHLVPCKK